VRRDVDPLQPQVFDLLEYAIRNRERVVSKDDLPAALWNGRIVSESATPPPCSRPGFALRRSPFVRLQLAPSSVTH
jgi:hypothetical protein